VRRVRVAGAGLATRRKEKMRIRARSRSGSGDMALVEAIRSITWRNASLASRLFVAIQMGRVLDQRAGYFKVF
jgi:hypothetical protein